MRKRPTGLAGIAFLVFLGLLVSRTAAGECVDCHEQQVKGFGDSVHGLRACEKPGDAACATCHGDGKAHMEAGGDKSLIKGLRGRQGADACLACHDKVTDQEAFRNGIHANSGTVNCLSCHSIHSAAKGAPKLLAKAEPAVCATCHAATARSFADKPFVHRMGRGGLTCSSCHEPHARTGISGMKRTRADEPACLGCHADKRGPFVYEHIQPTLGGCMSCHEPHGSVNPKQLKRSSVDQLCRECHSTLSKGTAGSQPSSDHNTFTGRWRNCTTCHVAVHGSNRSPRLTK